MPQEVFEILINILETFLMVGFITLYLGRKYQGAKCVFGFCTAWVVCFSLLVIVNYATFFDTYQAYIALFLYFLYALLFLRGDWMQKLWAAVITQAIASMVSIMSIGTFILIGYDPMDLIMVYNSTRIILMLTVQLLIFICFLLALRFRYTKPMEKRLWFALSIIPWVSVASLSTLMELAILFPEYQKRVFLSMLCILVANVMTYYFFVVISKGHEARLKLQILEQQNENAKKEMESSRAFVEEMRRVRHDIKNQLLTIKRYLDENKTEEASAYVERLSGEYLPKRQDLIATESMAFDAVVNAKATLCYPQGIDLVVRVEPETVQDMDDVDIGVLFGNLLDNAIEAAKESKEKRIFLDIQPKAQYVSIIIRNSIDESVLDNNPALASSKPNPDLHGVGLKSVRALVKKYNGMIQFFEENNEFCCHVLLEKKE